MLELPDQLLGALGQLVAFDRESDRLFVRLIDRRRGLSEESAEIIVQHGCVLGGTGVALGTLNDRLDLAEIDQVSEGTSVTLRQKRRLQPLWIELLGELDAIPSERFDYV